MKWKCKFIPLNLDSVLSFCCPMTLMRVNSCRMKILWTQMTMCLMMTPEIFLIQIMLSCVSLTRYVNSVTSWRLVLPPRVGTVVRALAFQQWGPGSIPWLGVMWVEFVGSLFWEVFLQVRTSVFPSHQKPTFDLLWFSLICSQRLEGAIAIASLSDWLRKYCASYPTNEKQNPNQSHLLGANFSRALSKSQVIAGNSWLVHRAVCPCYDWSDWLLWYWFVNLLYTEKKIPTDRRQTALNQELSSCWSEWDLNWQFIASIACISGHEWCWSWWESEGDTLSWRLLKSEAILLIRDKTLWNKQIFTKFTASLSHFSFSFDFDGFKSVCCLGNQ